jgi:hypothetical protein
MKTQITLHDKITELRTLFTEVVDEIEEIAQVNISQKEILYSIKRFDESKLNVEISKNLTIKEVEYYLYTYITMYDKILIVKQ